MLNSASSRIFVFVQFIFFSHASISKPFQGFLGVFIF